MAKRLSNTAAIVRMGAGGSEQHSYSSREVRKIDNGYVECVTEHGPEGHSYSETFSATPPGAAGKGKDPHGPAEGRGSLADAIGYLKGGK